MTKFEKVKKLVEESTKGTAYAATLKRGPRDARDPKGGFHTTFISGTDTWEHFKTLDQVIDRFSK